MDVHLIDGTYELFRHFFAVPPEADTDGNEVGAVRGVLTSVLGLIEGGATHVGVATDHVIESFRNDLYPGYKTGEGVPAALLAQFPVLEEALESMGVRVWPMVEFEADDALAAAAAKAALDSQVRQVLICTPDKDLAQCVVGTRVVQLDRMRGILRDEDGVFAKWGVKPESIPDYLAVVGDSADGFPGLPGWGPKSAALTFLAVFTSGRCAQGLAAVESCHPRRQTPLRGSLRAVAGCPAVSDTGDVEDGCTGIRNRGRSSVERTNARL